LLLLGLPSLRKRRYYLDDILFIQVCHGLKFYIPPPHLEIVSLRVPPSKSQGILTVQCLSL
jgi:hypothetical protein